MPYAIRGACTYGRCPERAGPSGRCAIHERLREAERPNAAVRTWYRSHQWQATRTRVLRKDPYCVQCREDDRAVVLATEVDHKTPHHGDPMLFWAEWNLQGLCATHHGRKTRAGL